MKKTTLFLLLIIFAGLFNACENILDLQPEDSVSKETFFSNADDFELALTGLYSGLRPRNEITADAALGGELFWDAIADGIYLSPSWWTPWFDIAKGDLNPNTENVNFVWRYCYKSIGWANTILEQLELKRDRLEEDFARDVEGEVRFIRALLYLRLTSVYGAVPLVDRVLTPSESKLGRSSVEDITNNLIIPDLDIAIANLGESPYFGDWGRATKQAAMGIKVRALLYNKDYEGTVAAAQNLMDFTENSNHVQFLSDFKSIFANNNENNAEILFSIKYVSNGSGNGASFRTPFGPTNIPGMASGSINGAWSNTSLVPEYINSFYMTDGLPAKQSPLYNAAAPWANRGPRFESTFYIAGQTTFLNGQPVTINNITNFNKDIKAAYPMCINKGYMNEDKQLSWNREDESDFIVIRYTDVLLMYAEAKIELNQLDASVNDIINMVRVRAGIVPVNAGMSQSELREVLRLERKLEFAYEGIRYFDIRRWGIAEEVINSITSWDPARGGYNLGVTKKFNPANFLWPIPSVALDANPNLAPNNSGY